MKKNILIILSGITVCLTFFWLIGIIEEPLAALGGAVLVFIGYLIPDNNKNETSENRTQITQINQGSGDNIARDKVINH